MNDEKYLLSICIPTYNGGDHLIESVRSILNAGYKNVEVVVNDNCSEDDSISKLREITDDRLKIYVNQKNEGPFCNLYFALTHGTGKYIMSLQDNDEIVIENLGSYLSALKHFKDIIVVKNTCFWMRKIDNPVSSSNFFYYSVILNHFSYSMYLRKAFSLMTYDEGALDIMKTCYPSEYWDIQLLSQLRETDKVGWINENLPIIRNPERKICSRTKKIGSSSGFINYTYEWNVYYAKEWIKILRKYVVDDRKFIHYALSGFYGKINMATHRYYDNMHDESSRNRYGIPFVDYSRKEWLSFNNKFYKMFLEELKKLVKVGRYELLTMRIMTILNRCRFYYDYFLDKKRNRLKHRITRAIIIHLKQVIERRLEYGIR